jgi:hypothetical protein
MYPRDNLESWQHIHEFIDEFPDDVHWSQWKPMVRDVVSSLEARDLAALFRIGQSMHHIIFSTLEHHGLTSEPRVTLEFHPTGQAVRVTYSCSNLHFGEALSEECVPITAAVPSTLGFLRRLWSETKPTSEIPAALNTA